jgi:hypothetical protein
VVHSTKRPSIHELLIVDCDPYLKMQLPQAEIAYPWPPLKDAVHTPLAPPSAVQ